MPSKRSLKPRRQPVQGRSVATLDAILEAAAQVFERHGYAAGTTNRIAERAGVSIGSLYQYFPNKDAILVALTERHIGDGTAVLAPLLAAYRGDPPPLEQGLRELIDAMMKLHESRPSLHRVLFEETPRPPALQERLDLVAAAARAEIERYLRCRPEVRVADPALAARLVTHTIESVTHNLAIRPDGDYGSEDYATAATRMLVSYLTAG